MFFNHLHHITLQWFHVCYQQIAFWMAPPCTSAPLHEALILSRPYVAGIFWVACAHLVPRVLLDYQGTALINEPWQTANQGFALLDVGWTISWSEPANHHVAVHQTSSVVGQLTSLVWSSEKQWPLRIVGIGGISINAGLVYEKKITACVLYVSHQNSGLVQISSL